MIATWLEERRTWAWFLGVGVIVHCLLVLALLLPGAGSFTLSKASQGGLWIAGLVITGTIFAGRYFQAMARRESALLLLTRPATAFEKWLLAVLVVAVAYPLAYTLAFQICNIPAGLIAASQAGELMAISGDSYAYLKPEDYGVLRPWQAMPAAGWATLVPVVLALQGFALLGSLYFHRWPFIKTLVAGFGLMLVLILIAGVGGNDTFFAFWHERDRHGLPAQLVLGGTWLLIPALVWLAALFALQERQEA
ncbi:hypothetical protein P873_08810 [Arenimonas composti TR7-09 = DSM 18010]|uniref:Uncharacterized protein n=1 Tax=Arenimonas composti TR7-09 = DSM 18010 TaxID=1121013 RepID=A0A091BGP3_9GAMM|nr:hypothetical protein P873_08810 [Arenimonas composti TR7-09 = DSM 18010]